MELRHLRYFVAVAEELSFSRAAKRLMMVQPALSQQIAELEKELGVQLFDRAKRQIKLTTTGRLFLEEARQVLARTEQAIAVARWAERGEIGRLVVGYSAFAQHHTFPHIVKAFRDYYPKVELILRELVTDQQLTELKELKIDVGFPLYTSHLAADLNRNNLSHKTFATEPIVAVLPKEHKLASQSSVSLLDLKAEQLIWLPRKLATIAFDYTGRVFDETGYSPRSVIEVTHGWTATSLVAAGAGTSFGPQSVEKMGGGKLAYPRLEEANWLADFNVIWRTEDSSPVLKAFLQVVQEFNAFD